MNSIFPWLFFFPILWLWGSDLCIMSCDCMALWWFGKPSRGPATHHLSIDNVDLCVSLSSSGMGRWLLFDTPPTWMRSCIHQLIRMYLLCVFVCVTDPHTSHQILSPNAPTTLAKGFIKFLTRKEKLYSAGLGLVRMGGWQLRVGFWCLGKNKTQTT